VDWRLLTAGSVRRKDIMAAFSISEAHASADIAAFDRTHPGVMRYDKSAKMYVPSNGRYVSQRGIKRSVPLVFEIE
jgi:hypothetical protein